jgi:outer membrane protein assembly factor BamB
MMMHRIRTVRILNMNTIGPLTPQMPISASGGTGAAASSADTGQSTPADTFAKGSVQSQPRGLDLKEASKLISYESENLSEVVTLWQFNTKHYDSQAFIADPGHFYEGGMDGTLRRFKMDGTLLWEKKTGDSNLNVSPAVAPDGTAYVSRVTTLMAYGPDGTQKWNIPLPDGKNTPRNSLSLNLAAGPDGKAYISDRSKLFAVDPNGKIRWSKSLDSAWDKAPVIRHDGSVMCLDRDGTVTCYDPTGKRLWRNRDFPKRESGFCPIHTALVAGPDGSVYAGTAKSAYNRDDQAIIALDRDGNTKWKIPVSSDMDSYCTPSVDQKTGTVYSGAGGSSSEVLAISPDGQVLWKKDVGPILHVTAMPEGKGVIVGIRGGDLHAIDSEGKEIWTFHTGSIFTKPSFGPDGTVYVGSQQMLYALETRERHLDKKMQQKMEEAQNAPEQDNTATVSEECGWLVIDGIRLPIKGQQKPL